MRNFGYALFCSLEISGQITPYVVAKGGIIMNKILSQLLVVSMFLGVIPVEAANSECSVSNISDAMLGCQITVDETGETDFDIPDYEPIVHDETIDGEFDFASEAESQAAEVNRSEGVSTWSLSSTDKAKWQSMYARLFGDAYLKPYEKREDGQYVTGIRTIL